MSDFADVAENLLYTIQDHGQLINELEALHQRHSVPDEPTEAMVVAGAGWREYDSPEYFRGSECNMAYRIYKAMIAAAKEK